MSQPPEQFRRAVAVSWYLGPRSGSPRTVSGSPSLGGLLPVPLEVVSLSSSTPVSVVSGVLYVVTDVGRRPPEGLVDFAGETGSTAHLHSSALLVQGCGAQVGDSVRFHEKGGGPGGKDVRVWDVGTDGATFVASPAVAF